MAALATDLAPAKIPVSLETASFKQLLQAPRINLQASATSMLGSAFGFDTVHSLVLRSFLPVGSSKRRSARKGEPLGDKLGQVSKVLEVRKACNLSNLVSFA